MWHEQTGQWLALSYEHANQVLRDRQARPALDRPPAGRPLRAFNDLHRNQMMENEPPVHTRLRSLVARSFARGHVERLRPRVAQMTADLLDRVDPDGFDLIADYAEPLPVAVVAELLGVPEEDRHLLRPWSQAIVAMYEYGRTPEAEERAVIAAVEFADYMRALADERRAQPREDLVSHLAAEEQAGERLTGDELVASAILLLNAGHEASVNGFGNGMVALMDHPDDLARLRAEPDLVEPAVEELLRFDSPLQLFERTAKEDVVVGGVTVEAGTRIAALLGAANRDPAAFPEPDRLDIGRRPNQHLVVRRRAAPLPRRPAGPDGAADRAADAAGPLPRRSSRPASRCAVRPSSCAATRRCRSAADRPSRLVRTGQAGIAHPPLMLRRVRADNQVWRAAPPPSVSRSAPRGASCGCSVAARSTAPVALDLRTPSGRRLPW